MNSFKSYASACFNLLILLLVALSLISCSSAKPVSDMSILSKSDLSVAALNGQWVLLRWALPASTDGKISARDIPPEAVGKSVSILFDFKKSQFSGYSGCNRFYSSLTLDTQNMIKLGPLASTKMMCAENLRMRFENDFVKVIGNYDYWALNDNTLRLFAKTGDVLSFGRRD